MDIRRSVQHTCRQLFYPPLDFVPAMYAGLLVFVGFTFLLRRDLFSFTHNYAVMEAWLPEWAWGILAVLVGTSIAFSSCGPHWLLRSAMFTSTLFLASIALALAEGPVGWGVYTTFVAYMALGSGRCYAQLGRGRRSE